MLKLKHQYFGHWMQKLTHSKRSWWWERSKAGGEGDDRGWDGWMASPTWWTWVWASSGSWWWTGKPGVPKSVGSQRDGHDRATELNWTLQNLIICSSWEMQTFQINNEFEHFVTCLKTVSLFLVVIISYHTYLLWNYDRAFNWDVKCMYF